jgi:hypothetical protein
MENTIVDNIVRNMRDYFKNYNNIKITLTKSVEEMYPVITVESFLEEVSVSLEFYIVDNYSLREYPEGPEISFIDIWRLLHFKSLEHFQMTRLRLLKELDKS